jgi:hypothetical protein
MMAKVFIPYGTTEGQTAKIAEYIADVIRHHGHEAEPVDINGSPDGVPDGYDGVIVGASIHMGKHDKRVVAFVEKIATPSSGYRLRSSPSVSQLMATPRRLRGTSSSSRRRRRGVRRGSVSLVVPSSTPITGSSNAT